MSRNDALYASDRHASSHSLRQSKTGEHLPDQKAMARRQLAHCCSPGQNFENDCNRQEAPI